MVTARSRNGNRGAREFGWTNAGEEAGMMRIELARERLRAAGLESALIKTPGLLPPEHYRIRYRRDGASTIEAGDDTGLLYGALDLAARALPDELDITDGPEFRLRGTCIGMQRLFASKSGNTDYLWPYTPDNFPFFYDRALWTRYLDFLLDLRFNALFLWNGHPFSSLVTLDDYPEAAEVTPEIMRLNRETMGWLTRECDRHGIWLIQKFYNIHLPDGVAAKYGVPVSLNKSHPIAADYTRKALAGFVEEYPSVGLMVCLGEALCGAENQVEWFTRTIIPGVLDGLRARGWSEADLADKDKLPPLVVRGHHIVEYGSHKDVFEAGRKLYPNLMSESKFNGESLTTWEPRGKYRQFHLDLAQYSSVHLANVHLAANLEPFRYAGFDFIRLSARAIRDRLDGGGIHLYPCAFWDWPQAPDNVPGLLQLDRDALWFEAWARYAWKLDRDPAREREHWINRLAEIYGTSVGAERIYEALNAAGECAPRLLRRFGITGGNRQALSMGMTLDQMVNAAHYRVWKDLRDSDAPPGEDLREYVIREWRREPHLGETPPQIIRETRDYAEQAVAAIESAAPHVTENRDEFERLRRDIHCIRDLTGHITGTAEAALSVIRHEFSGDVDDLHRALPHLEAAFDAYCRLADQAGPAYRYAASFHGRQMIPFHGPHHWSQIVQHYRDELDTFRVRVQTGKTAESACSLEFAPVAFTLHTPGMETYTVGEGARVFTDRENGVRELVPGLKGLTGIRFAHAEAATSMPVEIEAASPFRVLIGYFDSDDRVWLQVPALEHVAHANERGGYDVLIRNAACVDGLPPVNVHAFRYAAGRQRIEMIGTGSFVILGIVS